MDTPLERHLYRHSAGPEGGSYDPVLTTERGKSWSITMSPDGQSFVGTSSSPTQPPQTGLYRAEDGALITWIEENKLDETHPYAPYFENHTAPEYGTLTAEDGQTLYYSIQLPPDFDPGKTYPALVETYGGPHAQTVNRNWERLSDQFYSREGYVVFRLDNRGMANRGKAFEDVIYRQTGIPEVNDLLVGVDWLKSQPFVDGDRVGIQGWSYGGYMTMMTILQAPEGTFAAAVAGAPVTDWALYDTFYTERYMDTPQDNADGYEKSSVFYHLEQLKTELPELMLIHGMADDNVTFDNTTRLMAELQQRGIVFELMTYPGQRHGIRGQTLGTHLLKTRMAFLERHLK
jgi:dipeptidyl-peptidase-4